MFPQRRYTTVAFEVYVMLVELQVSGLHNLPIPRIRLVQTRGDYLWGEDLPDVPEHHATKAHTMFTTLSIFMMHVSNPEALRSYAASALVFGPIADPLVSKNTKCCCTW